MRPTRERLLYDRGQKIVPPGERFVQNCALCFWRPKVGGAGIAFARENKVDVNRVPTSFFYNARSKMPPGFSRCLPRHCEKARHVWPVNSVSGQTYRALCSTRYTQQLEHRGFLVTKTTMSQPEVTPCQLALNSPSALPTLSSHVRMESRKGRPTGVSPLDRPLMIMPRLLSAFLIWAVSRRRCVSVSRWDGVRPSATPPARSWPLRASEDRSWATTSRSEPARSTICTRLIPFGVSTYVWPRFEIV